MSEYRSHQILLPKRLKYRLRFSLLYLALILIFGALGVGLYQGGIHIAELQAKAITIQDLPWALTLSTIRILIAYVVALGFSLAVGILAARTRWGERLIIPSLDILQSIPIVGFFPAAIAFFISVTDGHRLGVELAAIFLIFTSQSWNMAFAVYESIKSIPQENLDAVTCFGIRGSARFWKLYLPVCIPRLVYNSLLSWANGWFFLVACEIIAQGPIQYHLPGIGSFLAMAAEADEVRLVLWGLAALTALILFMDFAIWRPATFWSMRFKNESTQMDGPTGSAMANEVYDFLGQLISPAKRLLGALVFPLIWVVREILSPLLWDLPSALFQNLLRRYHRFDADHRSAVDFQKPDTLRRDGLIQRRIWDALGWGMIFILGSLALIYLFKILSPPYPPIIREIPEAILVSTGRLLIAMVISLAWILPVVLFTWNRPRLRQLLSTVAQVGASLPAIALFPLFILVIAERFGGGMELASILLLLTGMQWYLLFNCLGGTSTIPSELIETTRSFGLNTPQTWKKLVLPAMRPALITGALTAWGGGWNALVIAEYLTFKDKVLQVTGIGALLSRAVYELGDQQAIALCLAAMVGWILLLNVIFWQPVYQLATSKFRMDL